MARPGVEITGMSAAAACRGRPTVPFSSTVPAGSMVRDSRTSISCAPAINREDPFDSQVKYVDSDLHGCGRDLSISPDSKWYIYEGRPPVLSSLPSPSNTSGLWAVSVDGKQSVLIAELGQGDGDASYGHPVW